MRDEAKKKTDLCNNMMNSLKKELTQAENDLKYLEDVRRRHSASIADELMELKARS